MVYLVIIAVMALALAPLWHFRPSKAQRRQAVLRERAALAGLFVEFRDLPLPQARFARLPAADRQVLYYGCRLPQRRRAAQQTVSWYRDAQTWRSLPPRQPEPEIAAEMPDSVLALGVSEGSCGLFWREQGEVEQVDEFARLLQRWRDSLTSTSG